jgi:hypothetical protein
MDIQGTKEAHKKQIDDLVNQHALEIRGRQMQVASCWGKLVGHLPVGCC